MFKDIHGNISMSKVWTNIAFSIASYVIVVMAHKGSSEFGEMFLYYLIIVSGSELGKKFLTMKYEKKE